MYKSDRLLIDILYQITCDRLAPRFSHYLSQKDAHQHDVYCQDGGGRAAALAGKGPGYTSPQQHQHQSSGAAPCADGLAWGFHGEGSDEGSNPGHKDSFIDKLGVKSPAMYSSQDLRDDGAVGDFAPVSTTDTVRRV